MNYSVYLQYDVQRSRSHAPQKKTNEHRLLTATIRITNSSPNKTQTQIFCKQVTMDRTRTAQAQKKKSESKQTMAFAQVPALAAAALLLFTSPALPSTAAESQARPMTEPTQAREKAEVSPSGKRMVQVPSSIGGVQVPPGSDLEKWLYNYLNDLEPTNTSPLAHGK